MVMLYEEHGILFPPTRDDGHRLRRFMLKKASRHALDTTYYDKAALTEAADAAQRAKAKEQRR